MPVAPGMCALTLMLPVRLHGRARLIAKRLGFTMTQLHRLALDEKVLQYEARFKREAEEDRAARIAKRNHRPKLNIPSVLPLQAGEVPTDHETGGYDSLYNDLAKPFLDTTLDREAVKQLAIDAVTRVKRECPITHPSDAEIIQRIERHINRLRNSDEKSIEGFVNSFVDHLHREQDGTEAAEEPTTDEESPEPEEPGRLGTMFGLTNRKFPNFP